MSLAPGTRLGPYEILAAIGAGGMGEVYRATDTRLKRDVAIKILPSAVATDSERLARFQRDTLKLRHLEPTDRVLLLYTHAVFFHPRDAKRPYADFEEAASIASANDVSLVFEDMIRSRQGRMCFFNGQLELATNAFAAAADALTRREGSPTLYLRYVQNVI